MYILIITYKKKKQDIVPDFLLLKSDNGRKTN